MRLHTTGASGSGASTLGQALASARGGVFRWVDTALRPERIGRCGGARSPHSP